MQKISLDLARGTISALAKERVQKFNLSKSEVEIVTTIVSFGACTTSELAKKLGKNRTFVSRVVAGLSANKVLVVRREGNTRIYH